MSQKECGGLWLQVVGRREGESYFLASYSGSATSWLCDLDKISVWAEFPRLYDGDSNGTCLTELSEK